MPLALCKIEDVKGWISGLENTSKQDVMLTQMVAMVSNSIEQFCNREFEYGATITEQHDSSGFSDCLVVRRPPIATVATLHEDLSYAFGSGTLIAATDYTVYTDESGRVQLLGGRFGKGDRHIKVVYAGGYTYATLPYSIKQACILQTVTLYKRREQPDLVSVSGAGGSISKFEPYGLLPAVKELLEPYIVYRPS